MILLGMGMAVSAQNYTHIDQRVRAQKIYSNNLKYIHQQLVLDLSTDEEKVRAFYVWITDNISYDYPLSRSKWAKDRLFKQPLKKRLQRSLKKRSAICGGYAELFREFCRLSNIEAEVVAGYSKTSKGHISKQKKPDHGWNKVKINGQWQLIDATWGSGSVTKNGKFIKDFDEHYFLTPPKKFYHNHFPAEVYNPRQTHGIALKQFFYFPIVHKAFFNSIDDLGPNGIKGYHKVGVGKQVTVYFEKAGTIWDLHVYDGKKFIDDYTVSVVGNTWSVSFKFDQPGLYYPVLFIECEPALTYKVKVSKIKLPI